MEKIINNTFISEDSNHLLYKGILYSVGDKVHLTYEIGGTTYPMYSSDEYGKFIKYATIEKIILNDIYPVTLQTNEGYVNIDHVSKSVYDTYKHPLQNLLTLQTSKGKLVIQADDNYFETKEITTSDLNKIVDSLIEDLSSFKTANENGRT